MKTLIRRFKTDAKRPTEKEQSSNARNLSARGHALFSLTSVFGKIGVAALPYLRDAYDDADTNQECIWFEIARARVGDSEMIEEVRKYVEEEPELAIRVAAIPAYARLAGKDAIPVLKPIADQRSRNSTVHNVLSTIAHGELYRLRRKLQEEK